MTCDLRCDLSWRMHRCIIYQAGFVEIKSMTCAFTERGFNSSSLITLLLDFSFGFGPTSECLLPSGICSFPGPERANEVAYWGTLGFPVLRHLSELAQIHVHCINDAIQPSHPLSSPSPPAFYLSQHQGLFQ